MYTQATRSPQTTACWSAAACHRAMVVPSTSTHADKPCRSPSGLSVHGVCDARWRTRVKVPPKMLPVCDRFSSRRDDTPLVPTSTDGRKSLSPAFPAAYPWVCRSWRLGFGECGLRRRHEPSFPSRSRGPNETPKGVDPLSGRGVTCRFRRVLRRARVVGSASKADTEKPVAVFLGKARLGDPQSAGVQGRIAIHDRYIRSIWVKTGPVRAERLGNCVHISLPALRPPALGGLLFYSVGPLIAVIAAVRRGPSAIVCQSPLEGLGAVLAVRLLPRSRRPPVEIEVHGDWRAAPRLYGSRARHLIAPLSDRLCGWALRRADRVHVVSEAMANQARRAGYGGPMDMHVEFAGLLSVSRGRPGPVSRPPSRGVRRRT